MPELLTAPSASHIKSSFSASPIKCSRRLSPPILGTFLEIWHLGHGFSAPSSYQSFSYGYEPEIPAELQNPHDVAVDARAMSWTALLPSDPETYWVDLQQAFVDEEPAGFDPPYDALCGTNIVDDEYFVVGIPNWDGYGTLRSFIYAGGPVLFQDSFKEPAYSNATFWLSWPNLRTVVTDVCLQNTVAAQKTRYRTNGRYVGWEAQCDLWMQHLNNETLEMEWGWRTYPLPFPWDLVSTRLWARNWVYRRSVTTNRFSLPLPSQDTLTAWNEIELPDPDDPEGYGFYYNWPAKLSDGFMGRAIFHIFEPESAWSARTGWEVSHEVAAEIDEVSIEKDERRIG